VIYKAIDFEQKFALLEQTWQPRVVAEANDYQFKLVHLHGDFIWHDHKDTDEAFIVLEGVLRIDFRDGAVHVAAGEMFVAPKGVEHEKVFKNAEGAPGLSAASGPRQWDRLFLELPNSMLTQRLPTIGRSREHTPLIASMGV